MHLHDRQHVAEHVRVLRLRFCQRIGVEHDDEAREGQPRVHEPQQDQREELLHLGAVFLQPRESGDGDADDEEAGEEVEDGGAHAEGWQVYAFPLAAFVPRAADGGALKYADEEGRGVSAYDESDCTPYGQAGEADEARGGGAAHGAVEEAEGEFAQRGGEFEDDLVCVDELCGRRGGEEVGGYGGLGFAVGEDDDEGDLDGALGYAADLWGCLLGGGRKWRGRDGGDTPWRLSGRCLRCRISCVGF